MAHPMNIRRGLFRLWVVTAATWVGVIVVFWLVVEGIAPTSSVEPTLLDRLNAPEPTTIFGFKGTDIWIALAIVIGPPIAVLAIGKAAFWIASGLKEPPASN